MKAIEEQAYQPIAGRCPVVGIGASAGGLEPMTALLSHLSSPTGLAYVVMQHLDPRAKSLLVDLLAQATRLPVRQVEEGMAVEPDHVYVCPANAELTLEEDHFHLGPYHQPNGRLRVIDRLFTSLSQARGAQTVGVLLSGMGSDGTTGLHMIRDAGGVTFAQDPTTASFSQMPQSAIEAGCVDHILSPEEIASTLAQLVTHAPQLQSADPTTEEASFSRIQRLLSQHSNVDFLAYKPGTLKRRMENRMTLLHFTHLSAYVAYLEEHPEEVERLAQSIWIGVTDFFRDPTVFEALSRLLWPALLAQKPGEGPLRIWVPGCSTGEEVYSLAISLHEFQQQRKLAQPFQIFATDINADALATARAGIYTANDLKRTEPAWRSRYFVPLDEQHLRYRIVPFLREHCLFAPHNLLRDPPFSHVHLISCRNVLIFLQSSAQRPILQTFHYALVPEGFLLLGTTESIEPLTRLFRRVERGLPLYSKQAFGTSLLLPFAMSGGGAAVPVKKEEGPTMPKEPERANESLQKEGGPTVPKEPDLANESLQEADRLLLANYAPASVVIDPNQEVVQVRGETSPYLQLAAGRVNLNLLKMTRPGLAQGVREAVRAARTEQRIVIREDLWVTALGVTRSVRVTAVPLKGPPAKQYCLVLFEEQAREIVPPEAAAQDFPVERKSKRDQAQRRIAELEQELSTLNIEMRATVEEHEAAMEELQSANEEIRASNEELRSLNEELEASQEELRATNEELSTTNQELSARHEQLKAAQEYAEAIVETARAPLVVLAADLRVEQANQAFYQLFQVTPAETEEHLFTQLGHGQWDILQLSTLFTEIVTANRSFQDFEVEYTFPKVGHKVLLLNARRLLLEEPPAGNHRILLAMEDITERRAAERQVEARLTFLRHLLDALPSSVYLVQGSEARLMLANEAATHLWGAQWPIGQPLQDFLESHAITICDSQDQTIPTARLATIRALHEGQPITDEQEIIHHADGTELAVLATAVPFTDPELLTGFAAMVGNGQTKASEPAVLVIHQRVQEHRKAEEIGS
jgi:two-component system CheB/CheR fusion protein